MPRRRRSRRREEDYDDYDDGYEPRRSPVWPIFLAIIAILAFTVGIFNFLYTSFLQELLAGAERYTIPSLVGLVYDDIANDKTVIKDFRVTQGSSVADEKPAGTILRQFPDGNTETNDPNAEITVVVSSGPETFLMPNVVNQDYQMAIVTLNNLGLVAEREYATDEEIVSNFVISSIPLADTVMHPGETVTLIISLGPEVKPATVPLMVGKSLEWAQGQIDFNNLGHGLETYEWSDEYPEGTVIDQNPAAYTEVPEGTKVNLKISKGVDPATLPPPEVTKSFYIALPDPPQATPENPEPSSDVVVTVMEGGQSVWSQTVNTSLDAGVWCTVTGTGVKQYEIYFDNVYQRSEVVNFEG